MTEKSLFFEYIWFPEVINYCSYKIDHFWIGDIQIVLRLSLQVIDVFLIY